MVSLNNFLLLNGGTLGKVLGLASGSYSSSSLDSPLLVSPLFLSLLLVSEGLLHIIDLLHVELPPVQFLVCFVTREHHAHQESNGKYVATHTVPFGCIRVGSAEGNQAPPVEDIGYVEEDEDQDDEEPVLAVVLIYSLVIPVLHLEVPAALTTVRGFLGVFNLLCVSVGVIVFLNFIIIIHLIVLTLLVHLHVHTFH